MDFIVDFLRYLEERHPVWGRRVATVLLAMVGVAVFGTAAHFANLYVLHPLWRLALLASDTWKSRGIGTLLSERGWAALLSGAVYGLILGGLYFGLVRAWAWNASRKLNHLRRRVLRRLDAREDEIKVFIAEMETVRANLGAEATSLRQQALKLLEVAERVRRQEQSDYDDFKRKWAALDEQYHSNQAQIRELAAKEFAAAKADIRQIGDSVVAEATARLTSLGGLPVSPPLSDIEEEKPQ